MQAHKLPTNSHSYTNDKQFSKSVCKRKINPSLHFYVLSVLSLQIYLYIEDNIHAAVMLPYFYKNVSIYEMYFKKNKVYLILHCFAPTPCIIT